MGINNFYNHSDEIDLRTEFLTILNGNGITTPKGLTGLIRNMKLDANGNLVKCPCVDKITGEPDKDYYCPICMSERYLWKESFIKYYKVQLNTGGHGIDPGNKGNEAYGIINVATHIFYLPYNTQITLNDKLVDIKLDIQGNVIKPIKRQFIWRITELTSYRSDNGKIDFIKALAVNETVKYLSPPTLG